MPESMNNLLGGMMTGFVGSKNKAKEMALNEEYKKIAMENVKATAKLHEAQIKKADLEGNLLSWAMGGDMAGGGTPAAPQAQSQPFAQYQPMGAMPAPQAPPQAAAPQPLEQTIAANRMPLNGGMVSMDPATGQSSYRNKNVFGVKYASTQDKFGGRPDTGDTKNRGFTAYPSLEASVAAGTDLIQRKYAPMTVTQGLLTYAPPGENPNIYDRINQFAKAFNIDPNKTQIGELPLVPFMTLLARQESPTQINPAIWGEAGNLPINQTAGKMPWDQTSQVQPAAAQPAPPGGGLGTPAQAIQPRGGLTREKFLKGYMKRNFGVEDTKYDYRIDKSGDVLVMSEGQLVGRIPGGPNAEWKEIPTGGYALMDKKSGNVLKAIPMPKPYSVSGKTSEGDVTHGFIYPTGTPGAGAGAQGGMSGAVITEPALNKLPGTLPETVRTKIGDNNAILDQLTILQDTFNEDYVGARGVFGKAVDATSGITGVGDPARRTWNQIYNEMLGQKLHTRGGSALTKQEIAYVMNTLPLISHNPDLFKSGIEAAKMLVMASNYELQAAHLTPDKAKYEKAANDLLQQYKTKFKPLMEQGLKAGPAPPMVKNPLTQGAGSLSPAGQKYMQGRGF